MKRSRFTETRIVAILKEADNNIVPVQLENPENGLETAGYVLRGKAERC